MAEYQKGQEVKIYTHWLLGSGYEGNAELVRCLDDDTVGERWRVRFKNSTKPVERWLLKPSARGSD